MKFRKIQGGLEFVTGNKDTGSSMACKDGEKEKRQKRKNKREETHCSQSKQERNSCG
jgi:hypothetical protein